MESFNQEGEMVISNEFAMVTIRKVNTRNGIRLEIRSPKLGYQILLDPMELESITWQQKAVFSQFLETPFGSKAHHT
ncbi:hypothetical protein P9314_02645 [Paenibacillus validus]|uniref:hypothetical protein n=1 Tax=Paenibacillus TaxID=44249 RepID=UPI000A5793C2|nr:MULTISPECIES: hypothetical protein [Paenibacillus]MED4599603.1 hypothetical protein [Paenibacillus validus]MED4604632.1 hypothetical protein [Paenibacillus validus]